MTAERVPGNFACPEAIPGGPQDVFSILAAVLTRTSGTEPVPPSGPGEGPA